MRILTALSLAIGLAISMGTHPVEAADFPEVLFILDASGSMTESAGGIAKIDAAKQALTQVVTGLAKEVNTGLVVYGHRRKGDCGDIEVIIPPGSRDREATWHVLEL